ncbi:p-loop containing nucleoside triphosphate hydrolase protein [Phaffia rhodozyma]|uniref:Replication factor C subunit 2 n=1 Tax=Phaffia rhodozyma TaxID=264483 RepID=A0A0F7SQV0_PHARH|nr:p-loop containing nucleoside triphosphate hydrolase protein [Phaffia rhodozyma]
MASTKMFLPQASKDVTRVDRSTAKQTGHFVSNESIPWVERYRPKTIDDVASQENVVAVLQKTLTSTNLPHMLFYGPPGTGKTSTILALSKQLFGPDSFRTRVLELNASDERGISVVREKIKSFAKETPRNTNAVASDGKTYPFPPYKIIILDEADSMTQDAQSALRRIMETYSKITRFCLVCNYVTRIIEPLASRCSKFRFRALDINSTEDRLRMIAEKEQVIRDDGVIELLIKLSGGDLRRAITLLQSASRLHGATSPPTPISRESVQEISGNVPDGIVNFVLASIGVEVDGGYLGKNFKGTFEQVHKAVKRVKREGWSANTVLSQMHDLIITHPQIPARPKSSAAQAMAECDKALCEGGDEELHLLECCLRIKKAMQGGE